jgi:phospholipase D1/2
LIRNEHSPVSNQNSSRWILFAVALIVSAAAVVLWRYTPLAEWADPDRVAAWMQKLRSSAWAPLIVIGVFVIGGLIVFPLTLLITATAIVFDPLTAIAISIAGALANALTLYTLGRVVMRDTVVHAFSSAVEKLRSMLSRSGILAVATIRMVPIAPFTLVNLAAGAIEVRLRDYMIGTLLGVLPGTVALTAFGRQLREIVEHPNLKNVGLLAAAILAWIALSIALQRWASRRSGATSN